MKIVKYKTNWLVDFFISYSNQYQKIGPLIHWKTFKTWFKTVNDDKFKENFLPK